MNDEDEAALLAELRAIKSASERFDDGNDNNPSSNENDGGRDMSAASRSATSSARRPHLDPVSKRRQAADESELESDHGDSFSLMSISSLSHQKQGEPPPKETVKSTEKEEKPSSRSRHSAGTPPWKRKNNVNAISGGMDVIVAAAPLTDDSKPESPPSIAPAATVDRFADADEMTLARPFRNPPKDNRSGPAEDAELLALLKGVSAKSSASDRFADTEDDVLPETQNNPSAAATSQTPTTAQPLHTRLERARKNVGTPPWKRKNKIMEQALPENDVVVAAPPRREDKKDKIEELRESDENMESPATETMANERRVPGSPPWEGKPVVKENFGKPAALSKPTFTGERGGAAEDEELLAELRAISSKSSATDRFSNEEEEIPARDNVQANSPAPKEKTLRSKIESLPPWKRRSNRPTSKTEQPQIDVVVSAPPSKRNDTKESKVQSTETSSGQQSTPPWKQKQSARTSQGDVDVVVSAPEPKYGIKSDNPTTFQGERGGAAEDAELLALLRGVSAKSGAADRFAENDDNSGAEAAKETAMVPESPKIQVQTSVPKTRHREGVPPWKQRKPPQNSKESIDVVVATPEPKFGIKSEIPSTFHGERGGAAEDAELLALLRGVSAQSGAADRFAGDDDVTNNKESTGKVEVVATNTIPAPEVGKPKASDKQNALPPWKQKRNTQKSKEDVGVVVAAPEPRYGIKSEIPSAYKGDRGGAAEDAELLALLRGVSNKSGAADRFASDDRTSDDANVDNQIRGVQRIQDSQNQKNIVENDEPTSPLPRRRSGLPSNKLSGPWKNSPKNSPVVQKAKLQEPTEIGTESAPTSTFNGERGGSAEDAELLALLRGVSMKSGAAARFSDDDQDNNDQIPEKITDPIPKVSVAPASPKHQRPPPIASTPQPGSPTAGALDMAREELPEALKSRDWKLRSKAFAVLKDLLFEACDDSNKHGSIEAESIVPGLDDNVAGFLEDSNANALDKAVDFAVHYADICKGAGSSDRARRIMISLLKKNAFSGKASTASMASLLALKLMEVGENVTESVHTVIDTLIEHGLKSKKVKVVQASASLMCEAAVEFGAAPLPLASMVSCIPKMMEHSNPKVRESSIALLAEMCRSFGSKDPVQQVVDGMRPAQVSELDALLAKKPEADPPKRRLRSLEGQAVGGGDALAALEAGAKELEAKKFAARPAVKLMEELPKTEYSAKIKLAKWSEKVAALDIVLATGGEKPYKLAEPSSSNNYAPLISEMKTLLSHTHFAVNSKAMDVLAMLAEGVGEKLFPNLRPFLAKLLEMSKDKKLTKAVAACADSLFGHVLAFEHILEADAVPYLVDEKKSKNALVRTSALEFLARCVKRRETAGPRGSLRLSIIPVAGDLSVDKLSDSDAGVRNAAMTVIRELMGGEDDDVKAEVEKIVDALKTSNARAYKSLMQCQADSPSKGKSQGEKQEASPSKEIKPSPVPQAETAVKRSTQSSSHAAAPTPASREEKRASVSAGQSHVDEPAVNEAMSVVSSLRIPSWDSPEDDGGILACLKSTKWVQRQSAIKSISSFIESEMKTMNVDGIEIKTAALLQLVKEYTRGFKESNVNIMKAIIHLFSVICEFHFCIEKPVSSWVVDDGVSLSVQKISDRKLMDICKDLLTSLCTVAHPGVVLSSASSVLQATKSPVAHEEFMKWCRGFCNDFGASTIGKGLPDVVGLLVADISATNPKIRRETAAVVTEMYRHLGPKFRALLVSTAKKPSEKDEIDKCLQSAEFDQALQSRSNLKQSVAMSGRGKSDGETNSADEFMALPKFDLIGALPKDCVEKMGSKDGKASWKMRKEALDDIESAMENCAGLIDTSSAKPLVDLTRALRDRLADTQINLKPLAARAIGKVLGNTDPVAQAKLGKIVYSTLLNAAMNDIKKPMRDASLESINQILRAPEIDGGAVNKDALEGLVSALVTEINDTAVKSIGLASVLGFLKGIAADFPNLDDIASSRGESLGEKYAGVLIECLISSKSDTRAESSSLIQEYVEKGVLSIGTFWKASEKLKPAKQRSVRPILETMSGLASGPAEKENLPSEASLSVPSEERSADIPRSNRTPRAGSGKMSRSQVQARQISSDQQSPKASASNTEKSSEGDRTTVDDSASGHPLIARVASKTQQRQMVWPEYPEEPLGPAIFSNLKKAWSAMLPQTSILKLFPSTGIKKQDDAKDGCEILSSAILSDRSLEESVVISQLGYVLKWITFVLCSKEATVGLQKLLDLIQELFHYLVERGYEMSDSECLTVVPFIIEKAANAKGRFHDHLSEIVKIIKAFGLVPSKRLGPIGCVCVIERSGHAKARALACSICLDCIADTGLVGIGKKGVMTVAKSLSDESIPDNKNATLDLLEAILGRMNGDIQRLARICGPSFDTKSRELLEERWQRRERKQAPSFGLSPAPKSKNQASSSAQPPDTPEGKTIVLDELPALTLRDSAFSNKPAPKALASTSSFGPSSSSMPSTRGVSPSSAASSMISNPTKSDDIQDKGDGLGTAAMLRARLLKLKEKTKESCDDESDRGALDVIPTPAQEFEKAIHNMQDIFESSTPLGEDDPGMVATVESLKRFHSSLSGQQQSGHGLRDVIASRLPETMEYLTRSIGFACDCGEPSVKAGMSIQLLSVSLATLMALFRDPDLSVHVTQEDLMLLIRETATALLDPRLSGASELDEPTSTQMVRAINKTTISAATGASRHTSLQALMAIQQQLCLESSEDSEAEAFNQRMSRVITKLFARVIRAEEGVSAPYSPNNLDMEALICIMEDSLVACKRVEDENINVEPDAIETCRDMTRSLVQSILRCYGNSTRLLDQIEDLGIDLDSSELGRLVSQCSKAEQSTRSPDTLPPRTKTETQQKGPSVGVLVSAFVNAKEPQERQAALSALRDYKKQHGESDLKAHLDQVSPAFRAFLEDQLSALKEDSPEKSEKSSSMTERLRRLRSRVESKEMKVQADTADLNSSNHSTPSPMSSTSNLADAAAPSPMAASRVPGPSPRRFSTGIPSPLSQPRSRLTHPSPSRLPPPGSFRERLAASSQQSSNTTDASSNRAAALRARLEAIRHQNK